MVTLAAGSSAVVSHRPGILGGGRGAAAATAVEGGRGWVSRIDVAIFGERKKAAHYQFGIHVRGMAC